MGNIVSPGYDADKYAGVRIKDDTDTFQDKRARSIMSVDQLASADYSFEVAVCSSTGIARSDGRGTLKKVR